MYIFIVTLINLFAINTCLEDVCVDVNDILAPQWMPGTLLENLAASPNNKTNSLDGTINTALGTMIFHRSMMNQYKCRNYVANQIIAKMSKKTVQKRMSVDEKPKPNNMLLDEGSTSYENWLQKTSTLDDIYRHHHNQINNLAEPLDKSHPPDYHGVPEYMYYETHYKPPPVYKYQTKYVEKKYKKSDIFEIALTALAFLSFGLFIIHLIMSISAVMNTTTTTPSNRIVALNFPFSAMNAAWEPVGYQITYQTISFQKRKV
ncbi:unnamed protein product [Ceutorhynchus assimilis]|uniref:Uncharacterized protein n=1 Tax=Ceutorhynchus assimilis TaxID=467358 RepID=A0A9N9QER1_9CUCU|nr:unnamed protein product [Ceutorhynchus assimilis]